MNKEFKEGDEVFIKGILVNNTSKDYPFVLKVNNADFRLTFTKDGKYYMNKNHKCVLHHISELQPKYPKYMMVSHSPITSKNLGIKRYVIYSDETGYISMLRKHSKCDNGVTYWKYAKDIE